VHIIDGQVSDLVPNTPVLRVAESGSPAVTA